MLTRDLFTTTCYKGHTVTLDTWYSFVCHPEKPWLHGTVEPLEKGNAILTSQPHTDELVHVPVCFGYLATSQEETSERRVQCVNTSSVATQLTNALRWCTY